MAAQEFSSNDDITALPVELKRYEASDASKNGMRIRVSPTGKKTYIWRVRQDGKQRVIIIGDFPDMSIHIARSKVEEHQTALKDGALEVKQIEQRQHPLTVKQLVDDYLKNATAHLSPGRKDQVEMCLDKYVLKTIGTKKLRSLKTPQVKIAVTKAVDAGHNERARTVLGIVKRMFRYAEAHGDLEHSPAAALETTFCGITKAKTRDRLIQTEDIKTFWQALDKAESMSDEIRIGLRILFLSGTRTGEMRLAQWKDVDLDAGTWFIPEENSKTTEWTVPLSSQLLALFKQLQGLTGDTEFLFPGASKKKDKPVTDKVFNRSLARLFKLTDKDGERVLDIPKVSPHDFRRTMRTAMAEKLDIDDNIAEKCLNHANGGKVQRAYNKSKLLDQRRDALEKWGDYVDLLVNPRDNVTVLSNVG